VSVVKAVFKRNLASFFGNPAGYVFIGLFVFMTAWFAFVDEEFFANNQANLDPLTEHMPWILLVFVSSVTMSSWSEEKKLGTDQLLFTLPSGDMSVVLGKFLADLAIFTAALAFTLSHVFILIYLGEPDMGLIFSTYLGYWLMGAAFIATGMFASSLTSNVTVGFILGALFCAVFAFSQEVALILPGRLGDTFLGLSAKNHIEAFGRGIVAFKDIFYFLSIAATMIFLNAVVLSRRKWPGGFLRLKNNPRFHTTIRVAAVLLIALSSNVLVARFGGRMDITEEKIYSLSEETRNIVESLDPEKPVYIQAWISKEVPRKPYNFVETRDRILGLLKELDELGSDRVLVKIHEPELISEEAQNAEENFKIRPVEVGREEEGIVSSEKIFMGAAIICGTEEEVIPFFYPGIPVEYDLTRTLRVVSSAERPKVGFVDNELKIFGGFNMQTFRPDPSWAIVNELKKQYEVVQINADVKIADNIDVVVVGLPSLLSDSQLDNVITAIKSGKPMLLLTDPLPICSPTLSPEAPRQEQQQSPYGPQRPPPAPKCDLTRLLDLLGVKLPNNEIVWDKTANPYPRLDHLPPQCVFVRPTDDAAGFNATDEVTSGLQEMLTLFPGWLEEVRSDLTFEPLLTTSLTATGVLEWGNMCSSSPRGFGMLTNDQLMDLPLQRSPERYALAARISGTLPAEETEKEEGDEKAEPGEPAPINVILLADLDIISNDFFGLRQVGRIDLDNVTFILNCVDSLAGDDSYIALRKKRLKSRTLSTIEKLEQEHEERRIDEQADAKKDADEELKAARDSFDEKVEGVKERTDLDTHSKRVLISTVMQAEQQKFDAKELEIKKNQEKRIEASLIELEEKKRIIRLEKKCWAMIFPLIPPLVIAILVFLFRLSRENRGASQSRILRD